MQHKASRTAIIVVDMQNDFCSADGALAELGSDVARNADVARRLPAFLDSARRLGCLIVWVRQTSREELISAARRTRAKAMQRGTMTVCAAGSWGAELAGELSPAQGDPMIEKSRYSAFVGTPLHNLLRAQERDHVVVCGTAANVCVDSTIRDAYMADYSVIMPTDLVGWTREEFAEPAIRNLEFYFCDVEQSDTLLRGWADAHA